MCGMLPCDYILVMLLVTKTWIGYCIGVMVGFALVSGLNIEGPAILFGLIPALGGFLIGSRLENGN